MSYDIIETSVYEGQPVELYTFSKAGLVLRYNSSDQDITIDEATYLAVPLSRDKLQQSQDMGKNAITIKASKNLEFVQQYISSPPSDVVELIIQRYHLTDVEEEVIVIWSGRIVNVKFQGSQAVIRGEPIFTALRRPALRRFYQTTCPHVLYGTACGVINTSFQIDAILDFASGTTLSSGVFGLEVDGYLTGGYVEWMDGSLVNRRFILSHVGDDVTINLPIPGIPSNADVSVFPGCDHSLSTCNSKFSNSDNFGGFPYIPSKNPMGGDSVF